MTTSGTTSDCEQKRVVISANFSVIQIREEPATIHLKENPVNLIENLEEGLFNQEQKQAPKKKCYQ